MKLGYARVSTEDQSLALQHAALTSAGCMRVFQEKVTGAYRERPELERMLSQLRPGDAVIVSRLDRLARSTRDLLDIADVIGRAGAGLRSLSEQWADTTSPAGRMILTVFAGIAEFERELIRERTSVGRAAARSRGVRFGPPVKLSREQCQLMRQLLREGRAAKEVARMFGVHRATVYRSLERTMDASAADDRP